MPIANKSSAEKNTSTKRSTKKITTSVGVATHIHKSVDLSNINIDKQVEKETIENRAASAASTTNIYRHFHQTKIFIEKCDAILSHGVRQTNRTKTYVISANLPEQISYNIGSIWQQSIDTSFNNTMNNVLQATTSLASEHLDWFRSLAISGQSAVSRINTIHVWTGTKPFKLQLRIPIIDDSTADPRSNLNECLEILGSLSLPKEDTNLSYYVAPPPSDALGSQLLSGKNNVSKIAVQLGGILFIDDCIIEDFSVNYSNTKTMIKHSYSAAQNNGTARTYLSPLFAELSITIGTFSGLDSDRYSKMLWTNRMSQDAEAAAMKR